MSALEQDDVDDLLADVFRQTGTKITRDDPVVSAALIQSSLIRQAADEASKQIREAAQNASASQLSKLEADFTNAATRTVDHVRKAAESSAPAHWKVKIGATAGFAAVVCIVAGFIVGATVGSKRSQEEIDQMSAGRDFIQYWHSLDAPSQAKLKATLSKLRQ